MNMTTPLGVRDPEPTIAAKALAMTARRAASGLDNPIAVGAFVTYTDPGGITHAARVRRRWKGEPGFVYRIALASGDAVNVAGDRLERSEK